MHTWIPALAGRFIVFDGPDGSGKSTQFSRLAGLAGRHLTVCEVREPGGTPAGEAIRHVLLDPALADMSVRCEMLLYMASRAELVAERIRPALDRGEFVLADRFVSSTLAYQGAAGGLERSDILSVGRVAIGQTWPDLTVIFDVDDRIAASRVSGERDRIESKSAEYHRRVREGYLAQAREESETYLVIDASRDPDAVEAILHRGLAERFG
jgi:dTMP kinase